jgi:hypothetical protein
MSLSDDIRTDVAAAKKIRLRLPWWGIVSAIIVGLPLLWLFDHAGRFNLFLPTFNSVAVLAFAIAVKKNLTRHVWFWVTMSVLAVLHIPLILFVPWTTKWVPAIAIAALDSGDLIVILSIVSVIGKFMESGATE